MPQYVNRIAGRNRDKTARSLHTYAAGSPAVGAATAVLAATASAAASVVTAGITSPAVPRNLTATPGGTTANVLAVSVIIAGTDITGKAITETLPAFTAGAATAVTGVKAFRTVTSVTIPIVGAATTVAIGTGAKLGMPVNLTRNTVLDAWFNGVKEATPPTVTTHATDVAQTLIQLNSALNGSAVIVDFFDS
jgi:hypothetical protein